MALPNQTLQHTDGGQMVRVTYHIAGFDRLNFVGDIANTIPQDGSYLICALSFEADGVRANGVLTIQMRHEIQPMHRLTQRLRSVRGIVSLQESREQA